MLRLTSIVITLSLIVGQAGQTHAKSAAVASALGDKSQMRYETRVYTRRQCLVSESTDLSLKAGAEVFGALAAIFVPLLVQKAIGGIASALKKAGAEETLRDSGRLPTYLYQLSDNAGTRTLSLNPNLGCVLVVRGTFSDVDPPDQSKIDFTSSPGQTLVGDNQEDLRKARLRGSNIPVQDIVLLYEAAVTASNDQTALYYQSRFLEVHSFQGSRSSNTRGLVVSLAINGAGAKEGEPTLSLALVNLGVVKKDTVSAPSQLNSRRTGWLGGVGLTEDALAAIEKTKLPTNSKKGVMPVTIEATLVETENGNKALRFIGELLDATKEDVSKAVSSEILDKDKKAAAAAEAREKLRQDEEAAYTEYLKAVSEQEAAGWPPSPMPKPPVGPTAAQKVKIFEVEKTRRIWCAKYKALTSIGEKASGSRPICP